MSVGLDLAIVCVIHLHKGLGLRYQTASSFLLHGFYSQLSVLRIWHYVIESRSNFRRFV